MQSKKKALASAISLILAPMGVSAQTSNGDNDSTGQVREIEEVVVTGIRGSLFDGIERKRSSDVIIDSVSSEEIGKFPDVNLAEALQRVPGVSIDRDGGEGRFVTIRGLGPQFNTVLVNGRRIATENPGRSFSFDTVAANLVSSVEVFKTQQSEIREGGLGGTVNVRTARPFDFGGFELTTSVQLLDDENSGKQNLQGSFLASNVFNDQFGALISVSSQNRQNRTLQVNTGEIRTGGVFSRFDDFQYGNFSVDPVFRQLELNRDVVDEERDRLGISGAIQFRPSERVDVNFDYLYSEFDVSTTILRVSNWFWAVDPPTSLAEYIESNPLTTPEAAAVEAQRIRDYSQTVLDENGVLTQFSHGLGLNVNSQAYNRRDIQRPTKTQLFGGNLAYLLNDRMTLVLDAAWSSARLDNRGLDQRRSMEILNQPGSIIDASGSIPYIASGPDTLVADPANAELLRIRRHWDSGNDIDASNYEFGASLDYDVNSDVRIRAGFLYEVGEKSNDDYRTPRIIQDLYHRVAGGFFLTGDLYDRLLNGIEQVDPSKYGQPAEANNDIFVIDVDAFSQFINDPGNARALLDLEIARNGGVSATTQANYNAFVANGGYGAALTGNSYEIEEKVTSLYVDADFDFELAGRESTLTTGIRWTHTDLDATGFSQVLTDLLLTPNPDMPGTFNVTPVYADPDGPDGLTREDLDNSYDNLLPSANLRVGLAEDIYLRLAASKSLTRPFLEDLAPKFRVGQLSESANTASANNSDLDPYSSANFDASLEWYYAPTSLVSLAYFHKSVDDFIITEQVDVVVDSIANQGLNEFSVTRPANAESANINGLTFNWIHVFELGFGFQFNLTKVDASPEFDGSEFDQSQVALPGIADSMNAVAFYEKGPVAIRVAYNIRQGFLRNSNFSGGYYGETRLEPLFADEYDQLDMRISYTWKDYTVSLEGINLQNSKLFEHGRFENLFVGRENFGRRFLLGISASF